MKKSLLILLGFLFIQIHVFSQTQTGSGSVSLTSTNLTTPYTQDFNSLSSSASPSNTLPPGWYYLETGSGSNGTYQVGDGATNTANTYSYGSAGNSDRAFGTLRGSSGLNSKIGAKFTNNTGSNITTLTIQFTGEQWRRGNGIGNKPDNLSFHYSTDALTTSLSNGAYFTDFNLDFGTVNKTPIGAAFNGNSASNRLATSWTLTGLNITPNSNFWIRWDDDLIFTNAQEDGLAIDDFSILAGIAATKTNVFFANSKLGPIPANSNINFQIGVKATNGSTSSTTTADVALVGGTGLATEIGFGGVPYSTQTVTFPLNSNPQDQTIDVDIITPYSRSGNVTYIFQLQNVAGGVNAVSSNPIFDTVTIFYPVNKIPSFYRTIASGDWSNIAIWESSLDNTTWASATTSPDSSDLTISVRNTHTVDITIAVNIDETIIDVGGILNLTNAGTNVTNGAGDDIIVNGTYVHNGPYNLINFKTASTIQVNSGGIVQIADNTNNVEAYANDATMPISYANGSYFYYTANKNFAAGTYFPNNTSSAIPTFRIGGNNNISNVGTVIINGNFEIFNSSSFNLKNADSIKVNNGNFINNGTFNSNAGKMIFSGSVAQNIQSISNLIFYDISSSNSFGLSNESNTSVKHTLKLLTGASKIDVDGASNNQVFTLISDASGDASIAQVPPGASLSGSLNVQRFLANPIAGREYRYMSSPVSNATVSQWKSLVPITGIFADPSSGFYDGRTLNTTFPSLYYYDENKAFTLNDMNKGATGYPGSGIFSNDPTNALLNIGKGYLLFIRNSSTTPTLLNLQGTPNIGTVNIPFTYSDVVPSNSQAGWNFIGNPYASSISWNSIVNLPINNSIFTSKLDNTVYIRDNANIGGNGAGTMYSFVANTAISTPAGFNGNIASGQGFYVHASGTGNLTLDESVKSGPATFYRTAGIPNDLIRISLIGSGVRDETVIYFDNNASDNFDSGFDAYKWKNDVVNISTICSKMDTNRLAINGSSFNLCHKEFKLLTHSKITGSYSLDFSDFENLDKAVSITLIDSISKKQVDVRSSKVYNFNIDNNSNVHEKSRFKLVFEKQGLSPTFSQNGLTLISNYKTGNQWLKDGKLIAGATNKTYEVTTDGTYSLIVKYSDGCMGTSNERIMGVTGIENNSLDKNIIIFPNPVVRDLNVNFDLKNGKFLQSSIYNITGGMVFEKALFPKNNGSQFVIENLNLKSGTYILKLVDGNDSKFLKFIKE